MAVSSPSSARAAEGDPLLIARFRLALWCLSVALTVGAGVELAMLRHWKGLSQLSPWAVLGVLLIAALWHAVAPSRSSVLAARVAAVIGILGAGFGVMTHVTSNWDKAPLDATLSATWDSLPVLQQWWLAASGGAGNAPPLVPGFVALGGICLVLATMGLSPSRRPAPDRQRAGA